MIDLTVPFEELTEEDFARFEALRGQEWFLAEAARESLEDFIALMMPTYIRSTWTRVLCDHLEAVFRRDIQKLMIEAPPRHGKTEHCLYWLAWVLGREPRTRAIITSYSDNLAWTISSQARDIVRDSRYPFTPRLVPTAKGAKQWKTDQGGNVVAAGLTGSLTGRGGSRFIFDDPIKTWEEAMSQNVRDAIWTGYNAVLKTRVERIGDAPTMILPAYRWHDDDLGGRILNGPDAGEWTVLKAPALAMPSEEEPDPLGRREGQALCPEIGFTKAELEKLRDEWLTGEGGTPAMWYAMYDQDPVPRQDALFPPEAWGFWSDQPKKPETRRLPRLVRTEILIDTSFGERQDSDFTAWAIVGKGADGNFYWLDLGRKRMKFNELVSVFEPMHKRDQRRALVFEVTYSSKSAMQFLRARGNRVVEWDHKNRDKIAIAEPIAEFQRMGKCFLPEGHPAVASFIDEHRRFPKGKFDDLVSTTSMALERLARFTPRPGTGTYYMGSGWNHRGESVRNEILQAWEGDPFGKW